MRSRKRPSRHIRHYKSGKRRLINPRILPRRRSYAALVQLEGYSGKKGYVDVKPKRVIVPRPLFKQLRTQAEKDPLTGTYTRRLFDVADRKTKNKSLILFEIDDFRLVNKKYGYEKGDEYIQDMAEIIKRNSGGNKVYRLGGDEFAIMFPKRDDKRAITMAEKIRKKVRTTMPFRVSAGVSTNLIQADIFVREAKKRGKDQIFYGKALL